VHIISTVLDSSLRHVSVHNPVPPLTESDLAGTVAWHFVPESQQDMVRRRLTECLATGEPQRYRVRADVPTKPGLLFLVRASRAFIDGKKAIHVICCQVPPEVDWLTEAEIDFLRLIARHTQKEVAARMGITVQSVSWHERVLRKKLRLECRHDLLTLAVELDEESLGA
jgi:DNA-binding CsgD family transcriptional regulator